MIRQLGTGGWSVVVAGLAFWMSHLRVKSDLLAVARPSIPCPLSGRLIKYLGSKPGMDILSNDQTYFLAALERQTFYKS